MKFHDGKKKINKVDGGKKKAKRQYHKKIRSAGIDEISDNMPMTEVVGRAVRSLVDSQMKPERPDKHHAEMMALVAEAEAILEKYKK